MELAVKELEEKAKAAKAASRKLAFLSTEVKNKALLNIAEALIDKQNEIQYCHCERRNWLSQLICEVRDE